MLVTEMISETRVRHYSDKDMMIRQIETDILYEETDIPIEHIEPDVLDEMNLMIPN